MPHATDKVRWLEMLPDELLWAIDNHGVCYVPFGLAEPHGPYNALGLDFIKAEGIVERAARAHGAVVAPPFAWHIQERPTFPWLESHGVTQSLCSSIPEDLFYRMVLYQIRAIDARGFKAAILITGHYGGLERDLRLLCDYYTRRTGSPLRLAAFADCEVITVDGVRGDHAGVTETSQLMAIRPDLVDLSRKPEGWPTGGWVGTQFRDAPGHHPDADLGKRIITSQVERLGQIQRELLSQYHPRPGWSAPTMTDTEALWRRFELITRKYWVCSTTLTEYMKGQFGVFPGWEAMGE